MSVSDIGTKWLVMPWQPLVTSDIAVMTAVEESLANCHDTTLVVHTCQFVKNVMLQDFPAEVFVQRPAIVSILQALLERGEIRETRVSIAVIRTLYKLTRSLRYRICYYQDPAIASKRPNVIFGQSDVSWTYESSLDDAETPEDCLPEANYQAYRQQCAASQDSRENNGTSFDDEITRERQMTLPYYCTVTLKNVLSLLVEELPFDSSRLKIVTSIIELSSELVNLLIVSLEPSIWLAHDTLSLNSAENVKNLMSMMSELLEYFRTSNVHNRATYLHVVCLVGKILSNLVPLELADIVVTKNLKISIARILMDAPIFLINRELNSILEQYARRFNDPETKELCEIFDETRFLTISLEAATILMKDNSNDDSRTCGETLRLMWTARSSLSCHKCLSLVKKYVTFLQDTNVLFENEDKDLANKLILHLLANSDEDVRRTCYEECRRLISLALGVDARQSGKYTIIRVAFLTEPSVITEIICHGVAGDDETIKNLAEDIIVYMLKGKIHIGDDGWTSMLDHTFVPTFGLLQCVASMNTQLGQCVTKMLDPDIYESIKLSYIEVVKGNCRLLYSSDDKMREEALCRLIFLLGREKDSSSKLPRLSTLHGLPLSSLCIIDRSPFGFKRSEGNYQISSLLSVLELIRTPDVEPKLRKSALVQISVMLTDNCLHKLFIRENGLTLILDIMDKSLIEREYGNYPDSVIPLLAILKVLATTQSSVRHDLSIRPDVYSNVLRSLFLFPNNESVKIDASQLLCLLLYSDYIKIPTIIRDNEFNLISLPHVITTKMRLPINCKYHWKTSPHVEKNISISNIDEPTSLTFIRQFWYWQRHDCSEEFLENSQISRNNEVCAKILDITNVELSKLRQTSMYHCAREQLDNIQNSTSHEQVIASLDNLTISLKLWKIFSSSTNIEKFEKLPWERSFVRFLNLQPTNSEDCDLFVDVINFLYVYIRCLINDDSGDWLCRIIRKNVTRSLSNLIGTIGTENQDIHEAILKFVRSASSIVDKRRFFEENLNDDTWICFVELIVTNLCFGDQQQNIHQQQQQQHEKQQHFYNLAYLDWLLRCLTYLTSKCQWKNQKNLLTSLGNALIELIVSFYGAGTVSFMGLSITRNSIICLNHTIHEMQRNFEKNEWMDFWYDEDRNLSWLPMLLINRDPLVRASGFQLLSSLTRNEHTALQLLRGIALAPSELCRTLLRHFTNREECCIVREQACMALANLVENSDKSNFQYMDSLKSNALINYIEQSNIYYEISVLCSNIYLGAIIEPDHREANGTRSENSETLDDENRQCFVATPSLISVACNLLNNMIIVVGENVAKHIYEQSLDKYFLGCLGDIPTYDDSEKMNFAQYCEILEMYTSICSLLTNCTTHCQEFAMVANFSSENLHLLLRYLNKENYHDDERVTYLRKSLITEVYNFLSILTLTENGQTKMESIITRIDRSGVKKIIISICQSMKDSHHELRMSAIGCLTFLLSHEIRGKSEKINEKKNNDDDDDSLEISMSTILDNCLVVSSDCISDENYEFRKVLTSLNRLSVINNLAYSEKYMTRRETKEIHVGSEISKILIHLFVAHNYAKMGKDNCDITRDKDIVVGALTNLLCVSREAKRTGLVENLGETCLMILKEFHAEFNLQPYQIYRTKNNRERKVYPLLRETKRVLDLLMNFMYNSVEIKDSLARAGLADCLHKLWAWISLDDKTVTSALELVATFTTNCSEGTHSLTMTGLRRSSNATSLISTIINLICREIDKAGRNFDNQKIHFAFHVLRNAIHVHECRLAISKSNLLQLFGKIHPASTRRVKPWPLLEVYCLEFFNDFTFYEEGQVCVAKATDGLDVLIELARSNTPATRLLAISTLRNLVFNPSNRPRLLASVSFMNLLRSSFESDDFNEIGIAGSILWSLISNNQKGKLTIRSAGFSQRIQEVLGRLSLLSMTDERQRQDLAKILHYVVKMLSSSEGQNFTEVD